MRPRSRPDVVDVPFVHPWPRRGRRDGRAPVRRSPLPHPRSARAARRTSRLLRGSGMADLHSITIDEIVDFLAALGARLDLAHNEHLQEAFALTVRGVEPHRSGACVPTYDDQLARFFQPERHPRRRSTVGSGRAYLEGWVHEPDADGRDLRVRAFGARTTHVVAGNSPGVSAQTIVRNADHARRRDHQDAGERSGHRSRHPADDGRPRRDHPVTKHVSAVHWRGGDELVEQVALHEPQHRQDRGVGRRRGDQSTSRSTSVPAWS